MNKNAENKMSDGLRDYGPNPLIVNIDRFTKLNPYYRAALWTGQHLQVTLMSIRVGGDIGLEMHPNLDQFIRIESGYGLVKMGQNRNEMNDARQVDQNYAIVIPAGTWHISRLCHLSGRRCRKDI